MKKFMKNLWSWKQNELFFSFTKFFLMNFDHGHEQKFAICSYFSKLEGMRQFPGIFVSEAFFLPKFNANQKFWNFFPFLTFAFELYRKKCLRHKNARKLPHSF